MKAVLMSIRPQWCEKIFNGSKSIEVRKSRPSIPTPFKVLIYCTKQKLTKTKCMNSYLHKNEPKACKKYGEIEKWCHIGDVHVNSNTSWSFRSYGMHGKVIGSFMCDRIDDIEPCSEYYSNGYDIDDDILTKTCLTQEQLREYGKGKTLYGWHITEPKLFEKPRELGEFYRSLPEKVLENGEYDCRKEWDVLCIDAPEGRDYCAECPYGGRVQITRAPQSWCYIEADEN